MVELERGDNVRYTCKGTSWVAVVIETLVVVAREARGYDDGMDVMRIERTADLVCYQGVGVSENESANWPSHALEIAPPVQGVVV